MPEHEPTKDEAKLDAFCREYWPVALGLALDAGNAVERCGRRTCRNAGHCCLRVVPGRALRCDGATIDDMAIEKAAFAMMFACVLQRPPGTASGDDGSTRRQPRKSEACDDPLAAIFMPGSCGTT